MFQLPHLPFPRGSAVGLLFENDLLRGYPLDDLRWSFGATKGWPEEWVDDLRAGRRRLC